jgi:hypothetical protein
MNSASFLTEHLLVPEEEHPLRPPLARLPVAGDVAPLRAAYAPAVAEELERFLDRVWLRRLVAAVGFSRSGLELLLGEEPQRHERILGVPADVDDPAAGRDASRQQGVGNVVLEFAHGSIT